MKTFKNLRVLDEGTSARQRGEVQSPRSQKEYDALSPKDKKIIDKRTRNAFKQSISRQPGESPRNKRITTKRKNFEENEEEMNENVLMVHTKKTPKGDFRWMLQTIKYGKNTTVMTGNEPTRAKAMAAGKKAKKAAGKEKGMTASAKKNRKDYGDHLARQDEARDAGYKMGQSKDPYTVKYSAKKSGPVKISVVDGKKEAEKFLKNVKKQGMNGIIVKGWNQPGSTQTFKYGQSHDALAKAARYDTLTGKKRWGEEIEEGKKDGMWIVKYSDPKTGKPAGTTTPATHKKAEAFLKKLIARGYTGELVKEDFLEIVDEGGMGGKFPKDKPLRSPTARAAAKRLSGQRAKLRDKLKNKKGKKKLDNPLALDPSKSGRGKNPVFGKYDMVSFSDPKTGKKTKGKVDSYDKASKTYVISVGSSKKVKGVPAKSVNVYESGMGGDRHFRVKGGSIPDHDEIKAFYEKQKGSHSQRIAATKKHFGLQKMTVSAKGNIMAKGIREYEDIEKEIEEMTTVFDEATNSGLTGWERSAAKKAAKEYKKLMAKYTRTRVFDIPFAEFREIETAANKVMGVRPGGKLTPGSLVRDLEKFATNETYAPGNITRKRNPDFDERQGMFNSNYKRINGRSPSKAELRAAGVGKGGDNPKGVKAWKAAMAKLKASEGRK